MKTPYSISQKGSDFIVAGYIIATLFIRFWIEPQLLGNLWLSIALGLFALLFLWALIKTKILQPGLLNLQDRIR